MDIEKQHHWNCVNYFGLFAVISVNHHSLAHGLVSQTVLHTATGMLTVASGYVELIKIQNINKDKDFRKQIKHKPHVFDNT